MIQPPLVIAIQSQVCWGHVGNSAAAFPMRGAGVAVAEVPTTLLSNHPRHPTMRGRALEGALVADLLRGIEERGAAAQASWVLSGYLGRADTAHAVADFVARAKAANPGLRYLCDPVMGDDDLGFFAPPEVAAAIAERLVPMADALTPNRFELGALTGAPVADAAQAAAAARGLAPLVAVTGVAGAGEVATVVTAGERTWAVRTPLLDRRPAGTGDLFAGLWLALLALGRDPAEAAALAVSGVFAALEATDPAPWAEMPLTARLAEVLAPERRFKAGAA